MPTLFFPDLQTLRHVLAQGIVPSSISQFPVTVHLDTQGQYRLTSSIPISDEVIFGIVQHGGRLLSGPAPIDGETFECWHQLIPLEPVSLPPGSLTSRVLFDLPGNELSRLAGEIHRLAKETLELAWSTDLEQDDSESSRVWARVTSAPYFTLSRLLEQADSASTSAYVENARQVWVRAGYRHPLVDQILVPAEKLLFLRPPRSWEIVDDRHWVGAVPSFAVAGAAAQHRKSTGLAEAAARGTHRDRGKLVTPLRLVPFADQDTPELWAIPENALAALSELVRTSDQRMLTLLSFAVFSTESGPMVLIRAGRSKGVLPVLLPGVLAYKTVLKLPNLYIPCDYRLRPTLRRDALRQLLAPDVRRLTWLRMLPDGSFRPETLPMTAFHPLAEWVQYRIDASPRIRSAWMQAEDWSFERFSVRPELSRRQLPAPEAASVPAPPPVSIPEPVTAKSGLLGRVFSWLTSRKPQIQATETQEPATIPIATAVPAALQFPQDKPPTSNARVTEMRQRSEQLESRFLKELPQLTSEQQLEGWSELAGVYGQLNNHVDAAICWINGLWEQQKLSPLWAWGWLRAEATQRRWKPSEADLGQFLSFPASPERTRTIAAFVVWGTLQSPVPRALLEHLGRLQSQIDTNESHLSVRGAWLAKIALARLAKGDVLSLARTRDRLLDRLRNAGLAGNLDLPAFLQFSEAGAGNRLQLVRNWLRSRQDFLRRWVVSLADAGASKENAAPILDAVQSVGLKPEIPNTCAYADLMLAWGLARLRYAEDVDPLVEQARQKLPDDPVHALLMEGFTFRIQLAREGKSQNEPFPSKWFAKLGKLGTLARYRVEKLRQHSGILDSSERLQAYWASTFRDFAGWDHLRKQSIDLPGLDNSSLNSRLEALLTANSLEPIPQATVLSLAIDHMDRLAPVFADRIFRQISSVLDRVAGNLQIQVPLLEKAFQAAGEFDKIPLAHLLVGQFSRLLDEVRAPAEMAGIDTLTGRVVDCLRRLGLRNEMNRILSQVMKRVLRGQELAQVRSANPSHWPVILRMGCHIAGGWNACGKEDEAHAMMEEIRRDLYGPTLSSRDRTALALTYSQRLGELSFRLALGRFEELFQRLQSITLSGTTNTHYTLKPLELIDTMIRGIVHHNFSLAPMVRNWLIDDEQRVRQRIQREFEEMLKESV